MTVRGFWRKYRGELGPVASLLATRLTKLKAASRRQEREELVEEIRERVNYLYNCAKAMREKLGKIEKVVK